jgi:hypothetical protein
MLYLLAVNDPPSFLAASANITVEGDSGAYYQPWATQISAGPGESAQNVSFGITCDAAAAALFADQPAITVTEATGVLAFAPASYASGSSSCNVTLTDNDGLTVTAPLLIEVTKGKQGCKQHNIFPSCQATVRSTAVCAVQHMCCGISFMH